MIRIVDTPSIKAEVFVATPTSRKWVVVIKEFLQEGQLSNDPEEECKVRNKAAQFTLL